MSRSSSPLRDRLIFNVGAPRSGTFWLQRIVTAHPAISAVPSETHLISHGVKPLLERFHHAARHSPQVGRVHADRERMLDAARDFCDALLAPYLEPGAERLAERTPAHADHLDLIGDLFPDGRVIHVVRDGRDVARSIAAQSWGPGTVAAAGEQWAKTVRAAREAGLAPDRYCEVRYEDLLVDPAPAVERLYRWLELDSDEPVVAQGVTESRRRINVDASRPGVRPEKWRDSFSPDELDAFNEVAGDLVEELGYRPAAGGDLKRPSGRRAGRRWSRIQAITRRPRKDDVKDAGSADTGIFTEQQVADRTMEALLRRDGAGVAGHLGPDALVGIVGPKGRAVLRGEDGVAALLGAIQADPALGGTQTIGDVHAAPPLITYVLSFEHDGRHHDRLVVMGVKSGRLSEIWLYRVPLAGR